MGSLTVGGVNGWMEGHESQCHVLMMAHIVFCLCLLLVGGPLSTAERFCRRRCRRRVVARKVRGVR